MIDDDDSLDFLGVNGGDPDCLHTDPETFLLATMNCKRFSLDHRLSAARTLFSGKIKREALCSVERNRLTAKQLAEIESQAEFKSSKWVGLLDDGTGLPSGNVFPIKQANSK